MNLYETNPTFDTHVDRAAEREARHIAANRAMCLADAASELAEHVKNVDQAKATVDGLQDRLAELAPDRVESNTSTALTVATAAGDAEAAERAAKDLQALRAGLDPASVERLTAGARLVQARADLESARASLKQAEQAAMTARLAATEKSIDKAVLQYQKVAQDAHDRYQLLKELVRQEYRYRAAIANDVLSSNYAPLDGGPSEITLPSVFAPRHNIVRAVGRKGGDLK